MKKRLTSSEEFEIMKLVFDKFLWIGTVVMLLGLYFILTGNGLQGFSLILAGGIILFLFLILLLKEYEIVK